LSEGDSGSVESDRLIERMNKFGFKLKQYLSRLSEGDSGSVESDRLTERMIGFEFGMK
jgi:hypothetical protein